MPIMLYVLFAGAPPNTAGGQEEDVWHGRSCGEEQWGACSLQWPFCFPLQTGKGHACYWQVFPWCHVELNGSN